jgi:hypothetical protein
VRSLFKSIVLISVLILAVIIGQPVESNNPSDKELKKLRDKWLTVKSWSASYNESYTSIKTWEMSPGVTMKTTVKNTLSGTFTLDSLISDGHSYGEWYGYGNGSSISYQVATMTYSGPEGEITVIERTQTSGSGAIGSRSENEYGENWGGDISIDIYNGTYSYGFGGPDADGKATFSRIVQGLPTDYSELSNLPEELQDIFVPLGEKAEEWATYSGTLDDAQGVMVGGLAGFELFPDIDEPTEYPLPKGGKVLKGSYNSESITKSWTISPGGPIELLELEKADRDWIPDPEEQKPVTIKVTGDGLSGNKVKMRFTLYELTKETGFCLNSEDNRTDFDLEFDQFSSDIEFNNPVKTEDGWIIETSEKVLNASIKITPFDYGAWGKIKAEAKIDEDVWVPIYTKEGEGYITVPRDERGGIENKIADAFEIDNKLKEGIQTEQDEEGSQKIGDGLTAYEEYRGFMIGGDFGVHITTDPEKYMNLFVYGKSQVIRGKLKDGLIINGEIYINLLYDSTDYVSNVVRIINPNRGDWSVCDQHGLVFYNTLIPESGVVGYAQGTAAGNCSSPKSTQYIAIDLNELHSLGSSPQSVLATITHEFMHGCGVDHHGEDNKDVVLEGDTVSIASWNGINAGDITCTMQYGWADYYKLRNGSFAVDANNHLIPFQPTENKINAHYLCRFRLGKGDNQSSQLGSAAIGNCNSQVRVSDE